ncbi:MAG: PQQ-binding-like beta-propeller repeat protein [Proteobacteria bacterium]|nr:PQQ-binding-like beta-propeller repeat protein [Pseudomonadota bacterium]
MGSDDDRSAEDAPDYARMWEDISTKQKPKKRFDYKATRWYQSGPEGARKKANWKRRILLVLLAVPCVTYVVVNVSYIPDPRLFFHQPTSTIESVDKPGDWTTYAGNLKHTRHIPEQAPLEGKVRWSKNFSEATDSTPAVADGILYVGEYFKIHALNASTGDSVWVSEVTGPVHSSPAVAGQMLFFGLLDKRIIALNRFTGQLEWEFETDNYVNGSPTVVDGVLYIGSGDGAVYALDARIGRLIWKKQSLGIVQYSPTVQDGLVYVATNTRGLYSLSAKTGATVLHYRLFRSIEDSTVVANDLVYFISRDGNLYTLDHKTREIPGAYPAKMFWMQLWLMGLPVPTPTPQAGTRWSFSPVYRGKGLTASPAVTPTRLFVGDELGFLYAVDIGDGSKQWRFKAEGSVSTAPLALGDTVYFGSKDGCLYALNQDDGRLLWKLSLGSPVTVSPIYASSLVFARTKDGKLHAIE